MGQVESQKNYVNEYSKLEKFRMRIELREIE